MSDSTELGAEPEEVVVAEGTLPPDDFHPHIGRIAEVSGEQLEIPADLAARLDAIAAEMLVDRDLLDELATALTVDNVVLQGPPGTGKTSLARRVAQAMGAELLVTTAHPEWTTYDLIGRQELRIVDGEEEIVPVNGFFTEAAIECAGAIVRHQDDATEPQAVWLFIDEFNRAHLDRAFGELFTVLGTEEETAVELAYQDGDNRKLVVPRRFRIVATLNSIDREFVNTLSQALRRRFSFLTLDVPPKPDPGEEWSLEPAAGSSLALREVPVVVKAAADRVAGKIEGGAAGELAETLAERPELLFELFGMVTELRHGDGENAPYVPVGTATLIDVVELFLAGIVQRDAAAGDRGPILDWAAAVKLAPLFEAETIDPDLLTKFGAELPAAFEGRFRRELEVIEAAGLHAVPD